MDEKNPFNEFIEKLPCSEAQYKRESLEELREIKKELQNIRVILEYTHFPKGQIEFVDHKPIRHEFDPEAHLADLRKSYGIDQ